MSIERTVRDLAVILITSILILIPAVGWVMNIWKLVISGPVSTWEAIEILRCVGIVFAPLGAVMGYL